MTGHTYAARRATLRLLTARGPLTGAELRRAVKYTHRCDLAAALAALAADGQVVAETLPRGTRYRLAAPEPPATDPKLCARCRTNRKRPASPHCGRCLVDLAREAAT